MNKKGFTLMELLVVIVIIAVVSVGAIISFGTIDDSTAVRERENQFIEFQRSGNLYIDLHNSTLKQFVSERYALVGFYTLQEEGYIARSLEDPVTGDEIDASNYAVVLYIDSHTNGTERIDDVTSCIVDIGHNMDGNDEKVFINSCEPNANPENYFKCVANQYGKNEIVVKGSGNNQVLDKAKSNTCTCECLQKSH